MVIAKVKNFLKKRQRRSFSLFLTYAYDEHIIAHLYEHLVISKLRDFCEKFLKFRGAVDTGAIDFYFEWDAKENPDALQQIKDALLLETITPEDLSREAGRILLEEAESLGDPLRAVGKVLNQGYSSIEEWNGKQKEVEYIPLKDIYQFKDETLKGKRAYRLFRNYKPTRVSQEMFSFLGEDETESSTSPQAPKIKLKFGAFRFPLKEGNYQKAVFFSVPIRDQREAIYFEVLIYFWGRKIHREASKTISVYRTSFRLFKSWEKKLFWGVGTLSKTNKPDLKVFVDSIVMKNISDKLVAGLSDYKDRRIRELKRKGKDKEWVWRDMIRQYLDWGRENYVSPKELIKTIEGITLGRLEAFRQEKFKKLDSFYI